MFGLGWHELIILIIILLIVFGSTRLPQIGEALGKGIKNFQKALRGDSKNKTDDNSSQQSDKK